MSRIDFRGRCFEINRSESIAFFSIFSILRQINHRNYKEIAVQVISQNCEPGPFMRIEIPDITDNDWDRFEASLRKAVRDAVFDTDSETQTVLIFGEVRNQHFVQAVLTHLQTAPLRSWWDSVIFPYADQVAIEALASQFPDLSFAKTNMSI